MRKDRFNAKTQKECDRFTKKFKKWVAEAKLANGVTVVEVCEDVIDYINKQPPKSNKIKHSQTARNWLYGQDYPVNAKYCSAISELTGIPMRVLNPLFK